MVFSKATEGSLRGLDAGRDSNYPIIRLSVSPLQPVAARCSPLQPAAARRRPLPPALVDTMPSLVNQFGLAIRQFNSIQFTQ